MAASRAMEGASTTATITGMIMIMMERVIRVPDQMPNNASNGGNITPAPMELKPLAGESQHQAVGNIGRVLDLSLPISVELGRTTMLIKDILNLAPGSVVELDRIAGEPVDILANGKLIAKGEVVVIDENFGVRVVDIVEPGERVAGDD
ncbi:MAG: flagellar motor switch protein FliN [Firmicutes bacterium]|nr:flagellar motor switch protein FliN [Bacillota bacterium]